MAVRPVQVLHQIDANDSLNIFTIETTDAASLDQLNLLNGFAVNGGGILNAVEGRTTVAGKTISGNDAARAGDGI